VNEEEIPMKKMLAVAVMMMGCSQGTKDGAPQAPEPPVTTPAVDLENRAYVIARDSDDMFVIDLNKLEIMGHVQMRTQTAHMADVGPDFGELFVSSTGSNEVVVIDTRKLEVKERIKVGQFPTHTTMIDARKLLAVMLEDDNAVSFVDIEKRVEVKRLSGFHVPHFLRAAPDGKFAYVANLKGNSVTRVALDTLTIDGEVTLDGLSSAVELTEEGGFADAQIDEHGVLFAAHAQTGRVLAYDTVAQKKLPEVKVGSKPWIVFADHHFPGLPQRHVVPNFGDRTISLIDGLNGAVLGSVEGDDEAYGVNYSSLVPDRAFVMNRIRHDIAVVDTKTQAILERIDVGGTTETASTSADGKYIVATVSSANKVVILEATTKKVLKTFEKMGVYPWSVVIPKGQNYCH
jgi:YVTN family beta-propeller protein